MGVLWFSGSAGRTESEWGVGNTGSRRKRLLRQLGQFFRLVELTFGVRMGFQILPGWMGPQSPALCEASVLLGFLHFPLTFLFHPSPPCSVLWEHGPYGPKQTIDITNYSKHCGLKHPPFDYVH